MGDHSEISWCDASWTPIKARPGNPLGDRWHCQKVSPGCDHCYSERLNMRWGGRAFAQPGEDMEAVRRWLVLDEKTLAQPLHWRKPRKIFVCSQTDLFGTWVPDEWIDRVFVVMASCPHHTFQVLTKRAKRMRDYLASLDRSPNQWGRWPLPNVWAGVSIESQAYAWRANYLHDIQAQRWTTFISAEPLLGPLTIPLRNMPRWLIVGGESGLGFRPMNLDWARSLRDACAESGTAFYLKQGSGLRPGQNRELDGRIWDEWPA